MGKVMITRKGMRPVYGELVFAGPNLYVVFANGQEREIPAVDGKPKGFEIHHIS